MIKKLQALKAKKGFTLVELIVVIAIIGVLAAILVPTMLGYVTSSRVTSANSTAASIKNNVDSFLTSCDTAGYGMKQSTNNKEQLTITVTSAGWACTAAANPTTNFKGTSKWGTPASAITTNSTKSSLTSAEQLLCFELCQLFPEVKQAAIQISMVGGKCVAVAYSADVSSFTSGDYPTIGSDGKFPASYAWDNKTAGVASSGIIVGTAPAVALGSGS